MTKDDIEYECLKSIFRVAMSFYWGVNRDSNYWYRVFTHMAQLGLDIRQCDWLNPDGTIRT